MSARTRPMKYTKISARATRYERRRVVESRYMSVVAQKAALFATGRTMRARERFVADVVAHAQRRGTAVLRARI